ncbi:MAG: aspartate kinase [Alkalispirochaetaceae bacterium]
MADTTVAIPMLVMKFGGSSVRDGAWIDRVLDIAEGRLREAPLLVSSAMGKTTDQLVAVAQTASDGDAPAAFARVEKLRKAHIASCGALLSGEARDRATGLVEKLFGEMTSLVQGVSLIKECTPRTYDALLAFGELLSTTIIAERAKERGIDTVLLDSRNLLVTDENFTAATPDLQASAERIRESVVPAPGRLYIAQGFIASTPAGVTSTLGRGGSDFTATIFGAALQAERVEIWTDVDGIMSCDPRVVPEARSITRLSYDEASELAYFGARVVHPSTILPAMELSIPVQVRNTGNPEHPGTTITAETEARGFQALAGKNGITVITVHSSRMLNAYGFLSRLFKVFEEERVSVDLVATSEVSISVTVDQERLPSGLEERLRSFGRLTVEHDKGILCLVGRDLWKDSAFLTRVFTSIGHDIPVRLISLGSSDINLSLVIPAERSEEAMRRLHGEFFPLPEAG